VLTILEFYADDVGVTERIGSTHTLTPRQFVDDLKALDLGGSGSRAIPDGLRVLRGARPYQTFYDERYFTRDAPPPQQQQQQHAHRAPALGKSASARSAIRPGPDPSFTGSTLSVNSSYGKEKKDKEKKRRFLGF
jgi:syntaxin-binding protein 1